MPLLAACSLGVAEWTTPRSSPQHGHRTTVLKCHCPLPSPPMFESGLNGCISTRSVLFFLQSFELSNRPSELCARNFIGNLDSAEQIRHSRQRFGWRQSFLQALVSLFVCEAHPCFVDQSRYLLP